MNRTALLSAAAVAAVVSGAAPLAAMPIRDPGTVLWNQNSNFGYGIISDYSTSNSSYSSAAADDFAVPEGKTWTISEVDVTGAYFNGSGPASSESVTIYADSKGKPGKSVWSGSNLKCADTAGSFACKLGKKGPKLAGGKKGKRYWVSVAADCSVFSGCGEWGWIVNTVVHGDGAVSEQNGGHWTRIKPPVDLAFTLIGSP
jgi:hypothetical protein